ncbi:24213_t:CDS:2, partial [Racocetra persica]
DKEFIIKIVQEYIDLQDQSEEGFSITYIQERLKKQFETFNNQKIPSPEELINRTYSDMAEYKIAKARYSNEALLALEGARNIQENNQITPIIFPNTRLTQATQNYLLQHHQQLVLETATARRNPRTGNLERVRIPIIVEAIRIILQMAFGQYTVYYTYDQINNKRLGLPTDIFNDQIVKEIPILETPKLKEYYRTALISISVNQEILEERIKEILTQIIEGEIVNKITETLSYINNTKWTNL